MIKRKKPILILIAGCSGSGKSTIAQQILDKISTNGTNGIIICQDRYYIDKSKTKEFDPSKVNYDHPNAFDWELMKSDFKKLSLNESVNLPIYDYVNHCRKFESNPIVDADIIIFEGIHTFYDDEINKLADLKVFVEVPKDESLIRRLERDIKYRGRSLQSVIDQWRNYVRPMYDVFIEPLKFKADIIIPWNEYQNKSIEVIKHGIVDLYNSSVSIDDELLSKK